MNRKASSNQPPDVDHTQGEVAWLKRQNACLQDDVKRLQQEIKWLHESTKKGDLRDCGDCGVKPGQAHKSGCDLEMCSVCGGQWIACGHQRHDRKFARWTGIFPGSAEATYLGIDLNEFARRFSSVFFAKPSMTPARRTPCPDANAAEKR